MRWIRRPAVASYVALAFGRYVVEPFFAPCPAPVVLIRLVSILGLSEFCSASSARGVRLFDPLSPPPPPPPAAFVVAINCWSVSLASRTQVTLTFIKMFALVLIIIPGVIALAKGRRWASGSASSSSSSSPFSFLFV